MSFGSVLREYRLGRRLTQDRLAEKVAARMLHEPLYDGTFISRLETNARRPKSRDIVFHIAKALDLGHDETDLLLIAAGYAPQERNPIRVLVVDDHSVVLNGVKILLETGTGVDVVAEAIDAQDALAMVEESKPDVVLMDIHMPNMDGIEATRRIKSQHPDIKVIMLTSYEEHVAESMAAGASGYLLKDVSRDLLCHAIHTVINGGTVLKLPAEHIQALRAEPICNSGHVQLTGEIDCDLSSHSS